MKKISILLVGLLFYGLALMHAQGSDVNGTVTSSEDGLPIPGVSVIVTGTTTGTTTNIDGHYTISVPTDASSLTFSFVGMGTKVVEIGGQSVLDVVLEPDIVGLEEVVVTALGISRQKKRLGYSLTEVDSEELNKGTTSNLTSALSGKIAGVQVSGGTGQPGSSTNVVLRGYANIGRSTQPLYVIDGVPVTNMNQNFNTNGADVNRTVDFGNGINDLNSEDIESMSILRGATATSLYGSAAANGVIMITTKRGKESEGKPTISINSSSIFSSVLRYPMYQETFGQGWDGHFASEENGNWGPRFSNDSRLWGNEVNGRQLYKDFSFLEDQVRDFYEIGTMYDNSISISGGGEEGTYYVSYNNVTSDGVVPRDKDGFDKNSFKFNGTKNMKFLNVSTSVNYINKETRAIPTGQGQGGSANLFDDVLQHPSDISIVDMENYTDPTSYFNPNNYFSPYLWNPYFTIDNTSNVANVDRLIASTTVDVDLIKAYDVKGTVRFGGDVSNTFGHNYDGKYTLDDNSVNKGTQDDINGYYREFQRNVRLYNLDAILSGAYNFGGSGVTMNLTAGYNQYHRSRTYSEDEVKELVLEQSFPNLANTTATPVVTNGFPNELIRRQSVYGILELGFRDYLFLTGTARNTWSSALPKDNNTYFYPAASLGFIVSDAFSFLTDARAINLIKLRVGYGQAGNDAPPYVIAPNYVEGQVTGGIPFSDLLFPLAGVRGYEYSNVLGNPNLKPEISNDFETGIDLSLFNNQFAVEATYYNRTTEGMILQRTVATSSGFGSIWDNIGKIENQGIELTTTVTPIRTSGGLTWDIIYTFAKNNNKVVELTEGLDEVTITGFVSPSVAAIKGKTVSHIKAFGTQKTADGQIIVDSQTGRPLPTDENVDLGSTLHDYTMGFMTNLRYKNVSLFVQFDYRHGGKFISYSKQSTMWTGKDPLTTFNDRLPFVVPNSVYIDDDGNYQENTIPITTTDLNNYYTGEWNDEAIAIDKTYLKLREVNITFSLPKSVTANSFIQAASVSLVGSNLWLRTPAENNVVDPEISTTANGAETEFGEIRGYPSVRNYGFKVSLSF